VAVQKSLFDQDASVAATTPVAVAGKSQTLTREQKQFNKLIAQIAATRHELAQWRQFVDEMRRLHAAKITPLQTEMRQKRLLLLALYDQAMGGTLLNQRERLKLADIICALVRELVAEEETPELVRLYNKYSEISYEDEQEFESEFMTEMASEIFGIKLDKDDVAGSHLDTAQRIAEKVEEAEAARTARREARAQKKKLKDPKVAEREEQRAEAREQATQHATQSLREVYRKLASELHPDREPDTVERERKTVLMQKVNQAYNDGDLLTLLELQLEIEQINPDHLAGMARERLLRFNAVLTEQLQRLREALEETIAPFVMMASPYAPYAQRQVTPKAIQQSLNAEVADLRDSLGAINADLYDHADTKNLKRVLKHYRMGTFERDARDAVAELQEMMAMAQPVTRGKRRRR